MTPSGRVPMRCCCFGWVTSMRCSMTDARVAAKTLGLALTSRDKGDDPVPMAGFPYHQLESYLAKLIAAGLRAAVCEQVEDRSSPRGWSAVKSPALLRRHGDRRGPARGLRARATIWRPWCRATRARASRPGWLGVELSTGRFVAAGVGPSIWSTSLPGLGRPSVFWPRTRRRCRAS